MINVGIDFEYVAIGDSIEHLICCVMHGSNGEMRFWLRDGRDKYKLIHALRKMRRGSGYVLVAHAMELAEARCFKFLGLDPLDYDWRDTWMEAKILSNSFFQVPPESCSLVECLAKYLDIQVDPEYKKECRAYCITDSTEGHESDILDYCASDTKYLSALAEHLYRLFSTRISNSIYIHNQCVFTEQTLIDLAYMTNCSSEIASRGFPVDNEALHALQEHLPEMILQLKRDFEQAYPGTFVFSSLKDKVKATRKSGAVYSYLEKYLVEKGLLDDWEMTATGNPSTDSKLMKKYFKNDKGFGGEYYRLSKALVSMQGLVKEKDPWLANWVEDDERIYYGSLRPMSSSTGRFQPRISSGFIPGWAHFLYCTLNPPKGRMIFEWDFHAQETALQAIICKDPKYAEVYNARDTYLWMAWQLSQMTEEDYRSMPGEDSAWKDKFKDIRNPMKTFTLAWSYGAGAKHLAELAGIPLSKSERWVQELNLKVFKNAYKYKQKLIVLTSGTKYHGLCFPDGFTCRTIRYRGETPKSDTTKMNWPFQGYGAYIMRELVKKCHEMGLPAIATVHDAIIFECDEGDWETVRKCREVMEQTAQRLLGSDLLNCGKREAEGELPNAAVWHHHSLSDILNADLDTDEGIADFQSRIGNLVSIDDVIKFRDLLNRACQQ